MTEPLPLSAQRTLTQGVLCYLAVDVPGLPGPHLTPVVYAFEAGRLWVTTSRSSVKSRAWRRSPEVAGVVMREGWSLLFRGRVRMYDALDPLTWPAAALHGQRILRAAARFTAKNARFFAGYAIDARRVPLAWTPPGRVFTEIELDAGRVLSAGTVVDEWGQWSSGVTYARTFEALPRVRSLDLAVPREVRRRLGARGRGVMALGQRTALTVLPIRWRRVGAEGTYEAVLPRDTLQLAASEGASARAPRRFGGDVRGAAPAALTLDHASSWRAAGMTGMLLQGPCELHVGEATTRGRAALEERVRLVARRAGSAPGGPDELALARFHPLRIVWWEGWSSGTVRGRPTKASR